MELFKSLKHLCKRITEKEGEINDIRELKYGDIVALREKDLQHKKDKRFEVKSTFDGSIQAIPLDNPNRMKIDEFKPESVYLVHRRSFEEYFNEKIEKYKECVHDYEQKIEYIKFMDTNIFDEKEYRLYASMKENGEQITKDRIKSLKKTLDETNKKRCGC